MNRLRAERLRVTYDERVVVDDLTLGVPTGSFTAIVGPNACGKSTLLRALARILAPAAGTVVLDGTSIQRWRARDVARVLAILPQSPLAPEGLTVGELVAVGRHPYRRWLQPWSTQDEAAVQRALERTGTTDLVDRPVDELSGGQRQRAWVALALAQDTPIMLLDEPTTYLDLAHQIDVLELLAELHRDEGRTIVAVLHDLNQASRYATHLVAMRDGYVVATGPPAEVVDEDLVEAVFGLAVRVVDDPVSGTPLVIPRGGSRRLVVEQP